MMYHEHKPFLCPVCKKEQNFLRVLDNYDTEVGDGTFNVECQCGYELELDEIEEIELLDNKGSKFGWAYLEPKTQELALTGLQAMLKHGSSETNNDVKKAIKELEAHSA